MAISERFDWTDDVVDSLRRLWAEGHSTAEIGRRIGASKNAVVGKAHRLDLPGRLSPIAKENMPSRRPSKPPIAARLPDIVPVDATKLKSNAARTPVIVCTVEPKTGLVLPKPAVECIPPQPHETSRALGRPGRTCCWPIGEPGKTTFRFCDVSIESRAPYCPDHARRAYVRRAETSQDATSKAR